MNVSLGRVTTPTGVVSVLDPGYMNLWCHTRPPVMPRFMFDSDEEAAVYNGAIDLKITGPDAERAGILFDRSVHPLYLFDIPAHGEAEMRKMFQETLSSHRLRADLTRIPARIPHRLRADLTLERGAAGEMQFAGLRCCIVSGVPVGIPLDVIAEPMSKGPDEGRWRRITVVCGSGTVAETMEVGHVMVDAGSLMVADLDSMGRWVSGTSRDGLADFTFWGKDAEAAANAAGAPDLGERRFGWRDVVVEDARRFAAKVRDLKQNNEWMFGASFLLHDHWHELTRQIESNPSESGLVTLGDAVACGFRNTWGDGIFEVHRDLDAAGKLIAVRMELGTTDRIHLMRSIELRWKLAMVTKLVSEGKEPVRWAYREDSERKDDSGWRMFAGTESDDYSNDPNNVAFVQVSKLLERDPRLKKIIDNPPGMAFERSKKDEDFHRVEWKAPQD